MFRKRKEKKAKADEKIAYEGTTSLESNVEARQPTPPGRLYAETDEIHDDGVLDTRTSAAAPPSYAGHSFPAQAAGADMSGYSNEELMSIFKGFVPVELSLETIYVPFIPDYTPAIGDVDPFIKIPRPDGKAEALGLIVLDDPCINQSDPQVLSLQLESSLKGTLPKGAGALAPGLAAAADTIRAVEPTKKSIDDWVQKIDDLHAQQGPAEFPYTITPPAAILDLWEPDFQALLERVALPGPDIDLSLEEYARVCCAILDIPVGKNIIESIHMYFTNYNDVLDNIELSKQQGYAGMQQ